jgi:5-methylcytosine-specific restriction endonuclease McrA
MGNSRSYKQSVKYKRVRMQVFERDGWACVECGYTPSFPKTMTKEEWILICYSRNLKTLEYDHIIPWSVGGPATLENGQTLCGDCNRKKSVEEGIRIEKLRGTYKMRRRADSSQRIKAGERQKLIRQYASVI